MNRMPALLAAGAAAFALVSTASSQPEPGDALSAAGNFAAAGSAYEATLAA